MNTRTRFRRPTRDFRYNMTEIHAHGQKVHAIIEKSGRRWVLQIIEWGTREFFTTETAARQAVEDLKAGSLELV